MHDTNQIENLTQNNIIFQSETIIQTIYPVQHIPGLQNFLNPFQSLEKKWKMSIKILQSALLL